MVSKRKKSTAKRTTKRKTVAKKRTAKRKTTVGANLLVPERVCVRPNLRVRPKSRVRPTPKTDGLNGSSAVSKLVKAAKKEGERAAMKKVLKSKKAQADKVLKTSKKKINRLLKDNKSRITEILRSGGKRKRKTSSKPRQRIDNPFDTRRFRGNRRKKNETFEQRLKRVSDDVHSVRDQILYGIADGSFKFQWASIAKEAGYSTGERKKMLSILDNKGYTINKLAHKIWEDNGGSHQRGRTDDDIRDEIIDVLQTVSSRTDALSKLDRGYTSKPPF